MYLILNQLEMHNKTRIEKNLTKLFIVLDDFFVIDKRLRKNKF